MYLIHLCVITAVEQKLGMGMLSACLVSAPLVLGYAWAMHQFVELPLATLKKGIAPRASLEIAVAQQ
jgi:peptidoglycan/LPS O-acetylase OafA/YrhL